MQPPGWFDSIEETLTPPAANSPSGTSIQSMLPNLRSWDVPLTTKIPILAKVPGAGSLNGQTLYFTFFGIAYFVSSEISLTVGLSAILVTIFGLFFYSSTGMMFEGGTWTNTDFDLSGCRHFIFRRVWLGEGCTVNADGATGCVIEYLESGPPTPRQHFEVRDA